jgi:hypothetical protein
MVTDQEITAADPDPTTEAQVKAKKIASMAVADPVDLTTEVPVKAKNTVVMVPVEEVAVVNVDADVVFLPSSIRTVNKDHQLVVSRLFNESTSLLNAFSEGKNSTFVNQFT